jgi:hypothetical protein
MAKRGKKFVIHGAFKSKARAVAKEKRVKNAFVIARKMKHSTRYIVLQRKK